MQGVKRRSIHSVPCGWRPGYTGRSGGPCAACCSDPSGPGGPGPVFTTHQTPPKKLCTPSLFFSLSGAAGHLAPCNLPSHVPNANDLHDANEYTCSAEASKRNSYTDGCGWLVDFRGQHG